VTIVGDVEPAQALALVRKYYGAIPHSPHPIPQVYTEEPPQNGARRVILKRAGALGLVMIAYKAPDGRHADLPALSVLGSVLSSGENSRLSRALIDTSLASFANADITPTHDPGLFVFRTSLAPGVTHEQVEKAILAEIDRIKKDGVTAEEVERVIHQYRAEQAYDRDGTMGVAGALNEWIAVGDWTQYVTFPERVASVTPADVQRVAREYLEEDRSTTGWFIPKVSP
jgi:zinc protease